MVEYQACTVGLEAPSAPVPKPPALSFDGATYQHSPDNAKIGQSAEKERGLSSGRNGASVRSSLKRGRPDIESSAFAIEMFKSHNGSTPAFYNHQPYYPAVGATTNGYPQQMTIREQNGRATAESNSGVDPRMGNNHHAAGSFYPNLPGQVTYMGRNVVELLAELEIERRKNAELQSRVNFLEAKLGSDDKTKLDGYDKHGVPGQNGNSKKPKKQRKLEKVLGEGNDEDGRMLDFPDHHQNQFSAAVKREEGLSLHVALTEEGPQPPSDGQDSGVIWMSREEVTPADLEKLNKDGISERDDSGDSDEDEEDEDEDEFQEENGEGKEDGRETEIRKTGNEEARGGVLDVKEEAEKLFFSAPGEIDQEEDESDSQAKRIPEKKKRKERKKAKRTECALLASRGLGPEVVSFRAPGIMSAYKKAPKTAFCPQEVKRVMESGILTLKNAQSHTMRKIIIFASLGIRHGCDDMYELDFSHFTILHRGEPFKSSKDPGEHVLYDHPGVRRKIFYPNRQNPLLCPVRVLDEEKGMRPAGPTCPACLFLCIKYGGRTRNLPQNEYVRQRMGRNKLKSFGPLMCQMAFLIHIRTGSFFFKALGITLLFMAGFPDDLVRKETKYRNLDLLQKYYRSDEDAKGEQLFHPYTPFYPQAMLVAPAAPQKAAIASKAMGKKGPPPLLSKPPSTPPVPRLLQPLSARPPTTAASGGLSLPFSPSLPSVPAVLSSAAASVSRCPPGTPGVPPPPPFGMYPPPPYPSGGFAPMPWGVPAYPHLGHYPAPPFAYPPFPHSSPFVPPFFAPPYQFSSYGPQPLTKKEPKKETPESEQSRSDSESGSVGAGQRSDEKKESVDSKEA